MGASEVSECLSYGYLCGFGHKLNFDPGTTNRRRISAGELRTTAR